MNDELELIVQNMLNAGESEDNIALVIQNYVPEKVETITETTEAPAVEDTELVSEDISLDEPVSKPQASIMVGGNRVYLNEVIQSLQDQDNRPLEVQTKEYKDKVIDIAKDTSLNKQQKNEQISSVLKPSYLILKSGTGDEAVYEPRPEVKKKMADNMPESIKEFKTKEDLTNAINESIGKTIRDDEGIKALVEVQQFNKKDLLEEKALQIQSKADLTTPEGVAKAKKEFNDFYAAEVYGELEKSPAFNKIIKDLEVVGADVAGNLNKEWGRYNDDFLRKIDESESRGGIKESAKKSILNFKDAISKAIISGEQLSFEKESKELKELKYKLSNKSISLEDEVSVDVQEVGMYGGLVNKTKKVKVKDRIKELSKDRKQLTKDIVEGLEKVNKNKEYISLFTETPDVEGYGFEYFLNAAKAAPSIIAEQAVNLGFGGLSIFGGPITAGIATTAMFTPMYAENYWGALTEGLRKDLGREPKSEDYLKALENGDYASQLNSTAVAGLQTLFERFGAKKVLNSTFGSLGKNTASGIGSLYKGEIRKFVKNAAKKGVDMTESAFTERLTESAQSFLNQVSIGTQIGGATDMFKYIDIDQINKEGEMGMIAGFFMPFAGNVARQSFVELRNSARDVATKFDLTSNIELAQADKFFNAAQDNIGKKFKNGEITAEEKQIEVEALANIRNTGLKIPKKFGTQAKQKSFDLILERQKLQDNVNKQDEAFTGPDKQRIKEINTELGNIQSVETATRAAIKAVEKADIDIEVKELKDSDEVADFLIKQDPNITESKAKEAGRQRGFILSNGKTIVINKDVASKEGAVTTAAHEILHGVLFNTLNKGDESAFALANAIKMQLSNISTEDFKNSDLAARIEQYKADPNINEATKAEEVLTLFSEAIATGDIKFEEGVFTKLKDFVRRILQNAGFSNIYFNDSKDVYNFIKDYNKSVSKGKFTKAQVKAAKEGVAVSERLKDRVKDVAEKGVDETILKFSKTEENRKIKEIFDEFTGPAENRKFKSKEEFKKSPEFFDALLEIEQSNTLDASIRNTVSESYLDMNSDFVKEVKERISDKYRSEYDASKNSLFGWLTGKNISGQPLINRASGDIQIKRGKKPSTVSADKKIGGEDAKTTVAETLVSDDISPEDYTDMKLVQDKLKKIKPQQSKIAKKIDLTDNEINLAKRDIIGFLRKTDRPAMTDPKKFFKALIDYTTGKGVQPGGFAKVIYDKLSLPKDGKLSTKNKEAFIREIAEDLIALNKVDPAVMRRSKWTPFYELEIKRMNPTQTQKAIDEGRVPSTVNLKAGNDLFRTLDPSVDQVVEYLNNIRPDVLKRKMPKFLGEVIVKNEFNEIVDNPKQPVYDAKGNETNNTVDLSESITEKEITRGAPQVKEKVARPQGVKFSKNQENKVDDLGLSARDKKNFLKVVEKSIEKGFTLDEAISMEAAKIGKSRGFAYENVIIKKLKELKVKGFEVSDQAGGNKVGVPDFAALIFGNNFDVEVKLEKAQYSSVSLIHRNQTTTFSRDKRYSFIDRLTKDLIDKAKKPLAAYRKRAGELGVDLRLYDKTGKLPFEIYKQLQKEGFQKAITQTAKFNQDIITELYQKKIPPTSYIQIKDKGLFFMSSNPLNLPIPEFKADVNVTLRVSRGTKSDLNGVEMTTMNLRILPDNLTNLSKSDFSLDNSSSVKSLMNTQAVKILEAQVPAKKSNIKELSNSVVKFSKTETNNDIIGYAKTIDDALSIARNVNAPVKKIRVFDFDDTLATTKSDVLFTAPDGAEGKLNAEEFAKKGSQLLDEGYVFDFSEFNKVTKGKPGPLLDIAKKIQAARGTEDVFVLTARAPEAQVAIKEFLDSVGLNVPLENITGLGNSTGAAKAKWMVEKAAEGYNDFYFADDALQNVRAVSDAMSQLDVKSKTQLAKQNNIKFSKSLVKKLDWKMEESPDGDGMVANFKIKDNDYLVTLYPVDTKGDYRYQFELQTKTGSTQKITGTGNAISVFSTVYNGLLDAIKSNSKIKRVEFSADKSEPSRVRVYTSVMDRFAKDLGWNTDIWETTDWDGGGSFDFEITKPRKKQVAPVEKVLEIVDVKSKVQQAKFSLAKDLNSDFNKILENKTGIGAEKVYSDARAKTVGANKGKFKFFIPPSAEDFVGLLYPTLAKGKLGDQQMAWYKERLLNPFARAMENLSKDRVNLMADFKALKKELEVPKDLRKEAIDGFTNEQAVRVYLWNKQGLDIPGISKRDLKDLTSVINNNPKLKVFADQLQAINKSEGYPSPQESWLVGTITTDLINGLNTVKRSKYLEEWQTNSDIIFSKENLNKMEAIYGANYREAMENILSRMKTGKNRLFSDSRIANQVLDYINGSIGAIMFFNTRSAVLQTISSMNFINWSDNNVYKAGKAFANQKQYWSDFTKLMNSDFLKDRRQGLKLNISESEIADAAATSKNKAKAALNYLLQKGFLPTQIADSFAIASGGATFYRNKINALIKQGMSNKEAEEKAYIEFREIAEESQQSSRPDKISQQQASNVGRVVLAFANTPSQYARIIKKAVSDLKNKRGNWKNNVSKIIYYGAMQNLIFNTLQQALFTIGFGYTDDDEKDKKYTKVANGMVDSLLRGLGYGGAAVAVGKNLLLNVYERSKRDRPEYVDAAWKMLDFSPPIASKVSKLKAAGYMVDKYEDEMSYKGFSIDNPAYEAASKVISATTNVPLDRLFSKVNNISAAMESDTEAWQSLAMMLGWSEWQIKPAKKQEEQNYILIR